MARNPNWYDLNEQRSYPLDEIATHQSTDGEQIPYGLLVDMNIQFPKTLGTYAYVSSIVVGPKVASLTIISDIGVPLATISVVNPEKWRHYPVDPGADGVGGWVVFGSGINYLEEPQSFRFDGLSSGKLMPKVARSYQERAVAGMGKNNVEALLSGIVALNAGNDLEIVKESREIEGKVVDAIVVRLKDQTGGDESRNIYKDYVGECGARPESHTCAGNLPIEYINSVQPDCFGNITVELRGCSDITIDESGCGILVDCDLGLSEACVTADHLPDAEGKLPNEYDDLCVDVSISIVTDDDVISDDDSYELTYDPPDCTPNHMGSLPYSEDFVSGSIPAEFTMIQGSSAVEFDNQDAAFGGMSLVFNPQNSANATFNTNKGQGALGVFDKGAIFTDAAWKSLCRDIDVWLVIKAGSGVGIRRNAGVVFNYRNSAAIIGGKDYWAAFIDWDDKTFSLRHFNGAGYTELASVAFSNVKINQQYQISVDIYDADNENVWVTTTVTNSLDPSDPDYVNLTIGPTIVDHFDPDTGHIGFVAYRSEVDFNKITIGNAT